MLPQLLPPLERGNAFDGIVFGERSPGKWMAGSEFFRRTPKAQDGSAVESAGPGALLQIAIVYEGKDGPVNGTSATTLELMSGS